MNQTPPRGPRAWTGRVYSWIGLVKLLFLAAAAVISIVFGAVYPWNDGADRSLHGQTASLGEHARDATMSEQKSGGPKGTAQ